MISISCKDILLIKQTNYVLTKEIKFHYHLRIHRSMSVGLATGNLDDVGLWHDDETTHSLSHDLSNLERLVY